ncbi:MAG: 50S ribosomal protein L10 [Candidatus Micrarchaeia archaeon]|jgi:large subunit ribosomal protein L10
MLRKEKEAFVKKLAEKISKHKTVAVLPLAGIPDRLLQKARNSLRGEAEIIVGRNTLIKRALGDKAGLAGKIEGDVALVLSDLDPFTLYSKIGSNSLQLLAKPGQIAPMDIEVKAGETNIQPGQAVTELKAAGLDVQIQKNKVVIAKDKKIIEAGKKITAQVANALKLLDIKPFTVSTTISAAYFEGLLFGKEALSITPAYVASEVAKSFVEANALSTGIGYVTPYNAAYFVSKAYNEAMALGISANIPEPEIMEKLVEKAAQEANNINKVAGINNTNA